MPSVVSSPSDVLSERSLRIPPGIHSLEAFRDWAQSDDFPRSGRIDYLQGAIEVDMSPEDLQTHGSPKVTLTAFVERVVRGANLGQVFIDSTVLSSDEAELHCEPDIVYASLQSLRNGRVRYRPSKRKPGRYTEIEGAADLVLEIVSDSSVAKDTQRLPPLYARAGVRELWLVDARGDAVDFRILELHRGADRRARTDRNGFQASGVLGRRLRLRREPWELPGTFVYFVHEA
jgi:Uma2 family endonuclease